VENLPAGQAAPSLRTYGGNGELARVSATSSPPAPERVPWRPAVTGAASLGTPLGIGILSHLLGEIIATAEVLVALTIIAVALFGSEVLSERAFRILRWFGNRPEPPAPNQ
jgi:hypothetical protein